MNTKNQKRIADGLLIIFVGILVYSFYEEVLVPVNDDYEFEIILKLSDMYDEPLFFVFHWAIMSRIFVMD